MDTLELEFKRCLRAGDLVRAGQVFESWTKKSRPDIAIATHWKAALVERQGHLSEALAILTNVIDAYQDRFLICRFDRALLFLKQSRWSEALQDFDVILKADEPVVKDAFHGSARFMAAFALARTGDARFSDAIEGIDQNQTDFVIDRILDRNALFDIYRVNCARLSSSR